jgi:hypothetical protein
MLVICLLLALWMRGNAARHPTPLQILIISPPRHVREKELMTAVEGRTMTLIESGEQLGIAVAAYKDGVEVAHIGGPCFCNGTWEAVREDHLSRRTLSYSKVCYQPLVVWRVNNSMLLLSAFLLVLTGCQRRRSGHSTTKVTLSTVTNLLRRRPGSI